MKKECEIVQDLLFGYNDNTLSNSSKELVEEHLKECQKCKQILNEIENDTKIENNKSEIDYLKKLRKKLNKKSICIAIITIILSLLIIFNIIVYINYKSVAEEMKIYLEDNITNEQLVDIENTIKEEDSDVEIIYNSKEQELENLKKTFEDNANLLSGYNDENNIFPTSYTIKSKLDKIENIEKKVEQMPGVSKVTTQTKINPYALLFYRFTK